MKVLITGATGFVGRNLMELISRKHDNIEILIPCRDIEGAKKQFEKLGFKSLKIMNSDDWQAVIEFNPEIVIHLAAFSTSKNDVEAIEKLFESNIMYGVKLLNALKDCPDIRLFVNTGSFAEYREGPREISNAYLYSATKSAFRPILDYYANLTGYKYIIAVPYSVYGGMSKVKRIFDYMLEALEAPKPVGMTAGHQILDFIHVEDVCAFYASTISEPERYQNLEQGKEFHLGTGLGHSLREVANMIEAITGKGLNISWGKIPYRDRDIMYAVAPISGNENMWSAKINLDEGLAKYMKQNGI